MNKLREINVTNKRVLVRCDFNVPINEKGEILDDFRIKKTLPTIEYLIENKAKIILMSHLDDPGGKVVEHLKMDRIAERLSQLLNRPVLKEDKCIGPDVEEKTLQLEVGDILLLENLRFYPEETAGDLKFAEKLSFLGDIYVNEAFSVSHRNHASITGVPKFLISCIGLLLEKEIENLDKIMRNPDRPMIVIIGGKKVETKSKFINKVSEIADSVIVSGLIKRELEEKEIPLRFPEKIIYPKEDNKGDSLDINEESIKMFEEKILKAKMILWNGPFGKIEEKSYTKGTLAIAQAIIKSRAFSVVGGGETVEFISQYKLLDQFNHVSTGGGAMLSYIAGEEMPGLEVLK